MVVGSTKAHVHIDPDLYSDWEALLIDDKHMLLLASEWTEFSDRNAKSYGLINREMLEKVCETQLTTKPKLMKLVSEHSERIGKDDKWIDSCSP